MLPSDVIDLMHPCKTGVDGGIAGRFPSEETSMFYVGRPAGWLMCNEHGRSPHRPLCRSFLHKSVEYFFSLNIGTSTNILHQKRQINFQLSKMYMMRTSKSRKNEIIVYFFSAQTQIWTKLGLSTVVAANKHELNSVSSSRQGNPSIFF